METLSTKPTTGYAVVQDGPPDTASYTPIVIGPGTSNPKRDGDPGPYTLGLQLYTSNPGYNGTTQVDVQFFGVNEDNSGNVSLIEQVAQIPDTNPQGHGNRKQTIPIGTPSSPTPLPIYITPTAQTIAIMAVARAHGGGSFGNCGVYWFDVPASS